MGALPIQWREPAAFVAGDTLLFQKNLPDYLPSDGWAVRLTVTQPAPPGTAGAAVRVAEAVSVADATGKFHCFNVPDFCPALDSGAYVLSEEVFNAAGNAPLGIAAGTRFQIYHDDNFVIMDDLMNGLATGPQQTEAQMMLQTLSESYRALIKLKFAETEDLRSRFRIQDQQKMLTDIKYWRAVRQQEIQQERMRNGKPSGANTEAVLCII